MTDPSCARQTPISLCAENKKFIPSASTCNFLWFGNWMRCRFQIRNNATLYTLCIRIADRCHTLRLPYENPFGQPEISHLLSISFGKLRRVLDLWKDRMYFVTAEGNVSRLLPKGVGCKVAIKFCLLRSRRTKTVQENWPANAVMSLNFILVENQKHPMDSHVNVFCSILQSPLQKLTPICSIVKRKNNVKCHVFKKNIMYHFRLFIKCILVQKNQVQFQT